MPAWQWLAISGLIHGMSEWLDMLALAVPDSEAFKWARTGVMAVSFLGGTPTWPPT